MLNHKILTDAGSSKEATKKREDVFEALRARRKAFDDAIGPLERDICEKQDEFFKKYEDFDILEEIDRDLAQRFFYQQGLFVQALSLKDIEQARIHGESLLRGYDIVFARMEQEQRILNFNKAAEQRGFGTHPGKPPPKGSRSKWWYKKYLNSAEWSERRTKVLKRCNEICEGCGENPATDVHHQTYDHVGYEFLFELLGLCRDCHARFHNK